MTADNGENKERMACDEKCCSCLQSDPFIVFVVFVTLMTDTLLYSGIVPILPEYLYLKKTGSDDSSVIPLVNKSSSNKTTCPESEEKPLLISENFELAILLGSKQIVQIVSNIVIGPVIDKIGCHLPMTLGYIILVATSLVFAVGNSYPAFFTARALQGVGSACATTGGIALIAERFPDNQKRGEMLGIALGGLGLGSLVGPPFSSVAYQFGGKSTAFIIIAALSFSIGILHQAASKNQLTSEQNDTNLVKVSHIRLLQDSKIVLSALCILFGSLLIPVVETSMPLWMMETMCAQEWMLGVIFFPGSLGFLVATVLFGWAGAYLGRWVVCLLSFLMAAAAAIGLPFADNFAQLIGPVLVIGICGGMLDASIYPIIGYLVDKRFGASMYGGAYAIAEVMYCAAFAIGPLLSGALVPIVGFENMMYIVAGTTFLAAFPVLFLREALPSNKPCCWKNEGGIDEKVFLRDSKTKNLSRMRK